MRSRPSSFLILFFALALAAWPKPVGARPIHHTPDEVVVVCNSDSPVSQAIARHYLEKRPGASLLSIQCQDSAIATANETIPLADYTASIETPVRAFLTSHPRIQFIVLTKGVPIRISGSPMGSCDEHSRAPRNIRGHPSVDSALAALDYSNISQAVKIDITGSGAVGCALSNRYWGADEPFSHAKFGGYLVTRLDAYTQAQAEALIDQAVAAAASPATGKFLLDVQPSFGLGLVGSQPQPISGLVITHESAWSEFNADLQQAGQFLSAHGFPVELDLAPAFVGHRSHLAGYFSWGSNDAKFSNDAYQTLFFDPGSFSDTAVSTSARTFLPTHGGQSLLADLLAHGLTCGKGYVDEPELQAIASPTLALQRWTAGYTMAESFYAASHFVSWEDMVIGDPLCSRTADAK